MKAHLRRPHAMPYSLLAVSHRLLIGISSSCFAELTGRHPYHVSRVLNQVRAHTPDTSVQTNLAACCAPTSASPLNLIYYERDGSNSLIKQTLEGMIINNCGCL